MIRGGCLCGEVAWEADGPMDLVSHCHCSKCRKSHGAAFATYGGVPEAGFRRVRGDDAVEPYASSPGFQRPFCRRCGAPLPGSPQAGHVFVPVGGVDDDPGARPQAHIFAASRAPWYAIPDDGLERFDAYPPGFDVPALASPERPASRPGHVRGSCLCDAVAWELRAAPDGMRHCHCSRCRKARGAAHASNAYAGLAPFAWLRGEDRVASFKLPEARFFTQAFCRTCGSALPAVYPERDLVVMPGGSIDGDPGVRPAEHIFAASKAPWFEIADVLPRHATRP